MWPAPWIVASAAGRLLTALAKIGYRCINQNVLTGG
jgi:hypothetical protein